MTATTIDRPAPIQVRSVPDRIRSTVPGHDYVDLFEIATPWATDFSAEEWLRAAFEGASAAGRFLAWQAVLNLQLERPSSPDHVVGWRLVERRRDHARMTARSWYVTADLLCVVDEGRVSIATFLTYDRTFGRLVWPPMSAVHRSLMPKVLIGAVRRITRDR